MAAGNAGSRDVAITGLGLLTPAGIGVRANWERVCSGVSCADTDESLEGLEVDFTCRVPGFDPTVLLGRFAAWQIERFVQLAIVATRQALQDAGLDPKTWDGTRVSVVLGNSLGGAGTFERQYRTLQQDGPTQVSPLMIPMFMVNMVAGYVAIDCSATGPSLVTATACASGTTAIGTARELLRSDACDVAIAGGTESALTPCMMAGLNRMGALSRRREDPAAASRPFDAERDGFVAAEAAGVLVLERAADARARGAPVRALVRGFAAASDAHHATAPAPSGHGIERAVLVALADAGIDPTEVDHINAHGTSTPLNDLTEGRVLQRVFGRRPAVTSTKGVTGHALAAAGAIEAAYTTLTLQHGIVPPTANLKNQDPEIDLDVVSDAPRQLPVEVAMSTSLGFGGHNAALVLTST
ncbi:MAG: beta-ketoacyl-[acyl-carrier-protein] synthase family protein [Pseudonocardiaceae bacterium]